MPPIDFKLLCSLEDALLKKIPYFSLLVVPQCLKVEH